MDVVIADDADNEELFADICYKDEYWGRVIYDAIENIFTLTIYPSKDKHVFPLLEVQTALEKAEKRLRELGYGSEIQH